MQYTAKYASPLGGILLAGDETGLTGLWFEGQKYFARDLDAAHMQRALPLFDETARWLDIYFSGRQPDFTPALHFTGSEFQNRVWALLREIPYGETVTYGQLAAALGKGQSAARAVGGAVGHNPISILVPCHRVLGAAGRLTGYAGGLDRKAALLRLEGALNDE